MATIPINLYTANTDPAKLLRQNGKYTHSFNIPIKHVGTTLVLLRSTEPITDSVLKGMIVDGNETAGAFDIVYYQLIATADLSSDTIQEGFTESLITSYRTTITAPSNYKTDPTDLFVANSLSARASRQSSRTTETVSAANLQEDKADGEYVTLVLIAAKEKNSNDPHIFTESVITDQGDVEPGDEDRHEDALIAFLNGNEGTITRAQILGYFPKDVLDFGAFIDSSNNFTISVSGTCRLQIAKEETNA